MDFETQFMPVICFKWLKRAEDINLPKKGTKRYMDCGAYMQGVMTAAIAGGLITEQRHGQLWLLAMTGRLEAYVIDQAKKHQAAQLIGAAP